MRARWRWWWRRSSSSFRCGRAEADVRLAAVLALAAVALTGCGQPAQKAARSACLAERPAAQAAPATAGMALIQGGSFQMGAKPLRPEEGPPRTTRVGSFWIDRTEVTN